MATRVIKIESCNDCHHKDHRGGFGSPAYIPWCKKTSEELPYNVGLGYGKMIVATCTGVIQESCPLEKA